MQIKNMTNMVRDLGEKNLVLIGTIKWEDITIINIFSSNNRLNTKLIYKLII